MVIPKNLLVLVILVSVAVLSVSVHASSFKFESSTDKLEINEKFGDVLPALTKKELPELQSGSITTKGTTTYNQYIRFSGLNYPTVQFKKDKEKNVQDFLYIPRNTGVANAFFEYELEFEEGLNSDISTDGDLTDLDGKKVHIFNEPYTITTATTTGTVLEITMVSGAASDFIEEEQTKQFTLGDKTYTIQVVSIEDSTKKVKLNVDGKDITDMVKGDIRLLDGGEYVGIAKILTSTGGAKDMAEVFIGAKVIKLKDKDHTDTIFEEGVTINKEAKTSAFVSISASKAGTSMAISKIKYRLTALDDVYAKAGETLSPYLGAQNGSMLANWDIKYAGLLAGAANTITFTPKGGDDEYTIAFKNKNGDSFANIPFISNKGTFKLGDSINDLIIKEDQEVSLNDYFVITDKNDKTGTTYIVKYNSIDTTANTFKVFDYATNSEKTISYQNSTISGQIGTAEITVGNLKANTTISSSSGNPLTVDLNTDGTLGASTVYIITIDGGVLVMQTLSGSTHQVTLRTEGTKFEESSTNEDVQFTFESRSGNRVGIQTTFTSITTETKDNKILGLSNYGVSMTYDDPGDPSAETLTFEYPQQQKFAQVYIEVGAAQAQPVAQVSTTSTCSNARQDGDETGIDCGGSCSPCQAQSSAETCADGVKNQGETGVDCGGPCQPCAVQKEEECPNGCLYVGVDGLQTCMGVGQATETVYCGRDKAIRLKKSNGLQCISNYECKIGICEEGKCGKKISLGLSIINIVVLVGFFGTLFYIIESILKKH